MGKLLTFILMGIVIIALAPFAMGLLMSLSPLALTLVVVFGVAVLRPLRNLFMSIVTGITNILTAIIKGCFQLIALVFGGTFKLLGLILKGFGFSVGWIFKGSDTKDAAKFMGWWKRLWLLGSGNTGFLVDGRSARLSENDSYESLLIQGGMGRGKTSTFVMPNLLDLSPLKPSYVILDTSGEIYQQTSGYLKRQGYQIRALNLMDPNQSETYNPLGNAKTPEQIAELAKILIAATNGGAASASKDPFLGSRCRKAITPDGPVPVKPT